MESSAEIVLDSVPVVRVLKDLDQPIVDASVVGGKHISDPMERLHEAHCGPARPVKTAGRRVLKIDSQVAEADGSQPSIGKHRDVCRHSIGQT